MKTCSRCQITKPLSDFAKYHRGIEGLESRCRACQKAKKQQEMMDAVDYTNHPIQTKTWIRNTLHTWKHAPSLEKRIKLSEQLYKKLLQTPVCPFTGEVMVPGINCNIDHIKPLSRGGKHNIANLQWTSRKYNMAKNNMTNTEFLQFIKLILKRQALQH